MIKILLSKTYNEFKIIVTLFLNKVSKLALT